ncbi:T9SS type A sorting domain-containing protein [Marinigracilibium pacificum]|uniref:T9SS type A sorting domain-containing protein n=1 Tax=Marinigracilibium pacificum TaxID=2729599 RepID=A0A848IYV6_9BACT|nr:T9SS type A sorting domain-containing protein [Marinigracilibium pacificum]NMM47179.1 T9SS type A sorting domain-containing protein [Marinigracilibium pacificum]
MKYSFIVLCLITFFSVQGIKAQNIKPISEENHPYNLISNYENVFSGGLNSPLFNRIDLNLDGIKDVVFFEKTTEKIYPYIKDGDSYIYSPQYIDNFPEEFRSWMVSYDFDGDGKNDLFAKSPFGVIVFKNTSIDELSFEIYSEVLLTEGTSGSINIQINSTDIPSLTDIDGDGDVDLFAFYFAGTGTIEFHRNMAVENYGRTDTLAFVRESRSWGNIQDCGCGQLIPLDEQCLTNGRELHAGGKSILIADINGDDKFDLLYGDEFCESVAYLINQGTNEAPEFSISSYPWPNEPSGGFQAPYLWDGESSDSLILVPNVFGNDGYVYDFSRSVNLYARNGSGDHILLNDKFIQNTSIDLGDNSFWSLVSSSTESFEAYVSTRGPENDGIVYKVTESGNQLVSEEVYRYEISNATIRTFISQISDFDNDGNLDVFFGYRLTDNTNEIAYISDVLEAATKIEINGISFLTSERVHFYDWDNDGLAELWKTSTSGKVSLYEASSNGDNLTYTLEKDVFKEMGIDALKGQRKFSFKDWNQNGSLDLLIADKSGNFSFIENVRSEESLPELLTGTVQGVSSVSSVGSDLDLLALGTVEGGLIFSEIDLTILGIDPDQELQNDLNVYPVPSNNSVTISYYNPIKISIISLSGQVLYSSDNYLKSWEIGKDQNLVNGIYIIRAITESGKVFSGRMIIQE